MSRRSKSVVANLVMYYWFDGTIQRRESVAVDPNAIASVLAIEWKQAKASPLTGKIYDGGHCAFPIIFVTQHRCY